MMSFPARRPLSLTFRGTFTLLGVWLCIGLLFYLPNNGGHGLSLPVNIITWGVMAACGMWTAMTLPGVAQGRAPDGAFRLICIGAGLWSLPLLWTTSGSVPYAGLPRVAGLWGMIAFLWLLRRTGLTRDSIRLILQMLWLAALMQALFGFLQVLVFKHMVMADGSPGFSGSRPWGIFQQPNLLASFVATGLLCLLASNSRGKLASGALFFFPFMLVLIQSRAAWIGAIAGCGLLFCSSIQVRRRAAVLLMLGGVALALAWQWGAHLPDAFSAIDKRGSTHERWLILKTTWALIARHPWAGWGYGSFEAAFSRQAQISGGPFVVTLIHPHNELLYAWAEGGIVAVAGLLLMAAGILRGLWQPGGWRWTGIALLLPLISHINLEYPLYQSAPHCLMLTLLLALIMPPVMPETAGTGSRWMRLVIAAASLPILLFMASALVTQQRLTAIERRGLDPLATGATDSELGLINPYGQRLRLDYDRHIALLIRYNTLRDPQLLARFTRWADSYLRHHNDPNVMASRLAIIGATQPDLLNGACLQARRRWPQDRRFLCRNATGLNKK
ncbi:O-antigen ligase [Pluralibacter gergoviae]|uniref:O-antigen ligase family protein n=1 Tax=Pluralibacter gergoviae TaxID=61647 RepID=UPI0006C67C64|nr:O-antigen ligase family protein [Pluralibacter gergoviae]KOR03680.1 hypothetical protein ABW48_04685 [Pluralibacter gergoviae]MCK1067789.1 O-antigen ligase family protein [Pluralibacter gergoviae]MCV7758994.1 O-antigen ligase family protein [Pluralibacter gergoviae]MDU4004296.1 O-antigen ligase family protein [Pluralibacter gergoviae]PHH48491.1 O-antigen ligase domain-containing protein [Pluralibacter gergoviae]